MRLYATSPGLRLRQAAADAGLLAWTVLWVVLARLAHGAVLVLAEPGQEVARLGGSVAGSMASAARAAGRVPAVGKGLATPLRSLGRAGSSVAGTGTSAEHAVGTLATVLALALVVLPVGWLLVRWLPWRLRWVRDAAAAGRADLELLAARALASAPLPRLAGLPDGTVAGWRAGDPAAVRALAALELDRLGLRLPAAEPAARSA